MLSIRAATVNDAHLLATMIRELAAYEQQLDLVIITPEDLARDGFGENPKFRALIAEWNGQPAGYALFFRHYSTWEGREALFIEDVFVRPEFRSRGIGKALIVCIAQKARHENCYGLRWEVLAWNEPAIKFYESLGATFLDEWRSVLIRGDALQQLAEKAE